MNAKSGTRSPKGMAPPVPEDPALHHGIEGDSEKALPKKGPIPRPQGMGRGNRKSIEGYEILARLGAGGQGAVYKARQSSMDRLVAVKVLLPKYAKETDGVQRFLQETRAIARLHHTNIVSGIDAGFSNGIYYYVMEYVEGESLERRIARRGRIPWREAVSILRQMAAALDHAWRHGLIHRDVKPDNIILSPDGTAKLADLGLARFAGRDGLTLTRTGFVVGTPYYIAPEQARGEEVDIRADLYSLGITLYEMLTGNPPFTGADPLVVLNRHLHETVRFSLPEAPAALLAIGRRMTARDRARRYAGPAQLLEDLEALEHGRPPVHARSRTDRSPAFKAPRPGHRIPLLAGGASAAAILILAATASLLSGKSDPRQPAPQSAIHRPGLPPGRPPGKSEMEGREQEASPREIFILASDLPPGALFDEFELRQDARSPGKTMIVSPNDGSLLDPPPENEACAIFKVQVRDGVPYRCRVRMKVGAAKGRSLANILYVQFTNAVDEENREIFTLGTADCLMLRAPPREGWHWVGRDQEDPGAIEPSIRFRTSGEITVRIAAGAGGVGFDQFVLSPVPFADPSPSARLIKQEPGVTSPPEAGRRPPGGP